MANATAVCMSVKRNINDVALLCTVFLINYSYGNFKFI